MAILLLFWLILTYTPQGIFQTFFKPDTYSPPLPLSTDGLASYFTEKTEVTGCELPHFSYSIPNFSISSPGLSSFSSSHWGKGAPSRIPSYFFQKVALSIILLLIFSISLTTSSFPAEQDHFQISTILKNSPLDPAMFSSYYHIPKGFLCQIHTKNPILPPLPCHPLIPQLLEICLTT